VANAFGGTVFVFIFHHSISGIVYPIRPQSNVKPMFLYSHIIGSSLLAIEGFLAWLAFSGLPNKCTTNVFPCQIADLFNENFVNLPFIGQVCNFYPMLNVSSVPVLTITLRNNLMEVIPIKRWLATSDYKVCQFLLQVSICIINSIGRPSPCQGSLEYHNLDSSNHNCNLREEPSGIHHLHWRHLWHLHPILHSADPGLACKEKESGVDLWREFQQEPVQAPSLPHYCPCLCRANTLSSDNRFDY